MKFLYITTISFILLFIGCKEEPTAPDLTSPQNLKISVIQDGVGLKLEWDKVSKANGYYVYFGMHPDSLLAIYKVVDQIYFIHESNELDKAGTGYYGILAVGGEYDSVVGPMSDIIRTAPYEAPDIILHERDYESGDSSAFGFGALNPKNAIYAGVVLSINDTSCRWHIYLDDGQSGTTIDSLLKFVTPQDSVGTNHPPDVPWDSTAIVFSTASYAPSEIIGGFAPETDGIDEEEKNVFYLLIDNEYYAKFSVQSVSPAGVEFNAYFQALKGFRRF